MPVTPGEYKTKANGDGTYRVVNTVTGKVHSQHTSKDAADQAKDLYSLYDDTLNRMLKALK